MNNCKECYDKGWLKVYGRLGDEIQMCQSCFKLQSDKQAYQKASLEINVSKYKYDNFKFDKDTAIGKKINIKLQKEG